MRIKIGQCGARLQWARRRCGLTQEDVAEKLNANRITVTRWENDQAYPSPFYQRQLCELFQQPMDVLFPIKSINGESLDQREKHSLSPNTNSPGEVLLPDPDLEAILDEEQWPFKELKTQEKLLQVQKQCISHVLESANTIINNVKPDCDPLIKAAVLKEVLGMIQVSVTGRTITWTAPTPIQIVDTLERIEEKQQGSLFPLDQIDIRNLKAALQHLDNIRFLASCPLSRTRYIQTRAANNNGISHGGILRGILVQEFLKQGFEHLRPPGGIRSDSAFEWQSYNILWYCYFGTHHLTHGHVAARLAMSERTFYRQRERALELLHLQLLELEVATQSE